MTPFDETAVFVKVDKLRDRMSRLGNHTNPDEWQQTRLLIRALTESVAKLQKPAGSPSRKVCVDAPDALSADWDELVDVLMKKGIKAEK
jgi:hypothetical protein